MSSSLADRVRSSLRDVPDFPTPGILFKDITPLIGNAELLRDVIDAMRQPFVGLDVTHVVCVESRGFIFGSPIALALNAGFVPLRKPGKLPWKTVREEYALEYRDDALEIHIDALDANSRVIVVDDVLATGGTARAACRLVDRLGGTVVGISVLVELGFLNGRALLPERRVHAIVEY